MTCPEEPSTVPNQPVKEAIKLTDKMANHANTVGKPFFSLEFFPPRNETELDCFWPLMDQLRQGNPLFMDITWHSRTSIDPNNQLSSLAIAGSTIKQFNHETVLHLCCCDYNSDTLESILNSAKSLGIRNILALRGDLPVRKEDNLTNGIVKNDGESKNQQQSTASTTTTTETATATPTTQASTTTTVTTTTTDQTITNDAKSQPIKSNPSLPNFSCARDLVKFIKTKYDDYFTIGVAGYPMGHPDALSYKDDLNYTKSKVDAGADFIVTQLSFEADQYINFIKDCRSIGIKVPIIPGIFPIQTGASIRNISKLTKVEAPDEVKKAIEACKGKVNEIKQYGLQHAVDLCKKLISSDVDIPGLHFYTLNRDSCVTEILKNLDLWTPKSNCDEPIAENGVEKFKVNIPAIVEQPSPVSLEVIGTG